MGKIYLFTRDLKISVFKHLLNPWNLDSFYYKKKNEEPLNFQATIFLNETFHFQYLGTMDAHSMNFSNKVCCGSHQKGTFLSNLIKRYVP